AVPWTTSRRRNVATTSATAGMWLHVDAKRSNYTLMNGDVLYLNALAFFSFAARIRDALAVPVVGHPHQEKPLRRGRRAGASAVAGFEDRFYLRLWPEAAAHVDQRPRDRPHHVVQEAVRLHVQPEPVAEAAHGQVRHRPHARLAVGPLCLKAAEV